jgi:flagellar hook-length control protein FliK
MPLNLTVPASPVSTSSAVQASAPSGNSANGNPALRNASNSSDPGNQPDAQTATAASSSAGSTPSASAQADAAANSAADASLFARLLGAQMDNLGATKPATALPGDPAAAVDKPAATAMASNTAPDPSLLLNPALLGLTQTLSPPPPVPKGETALPASAEMSAIPGQNNLQGNAAALAAANSLQAISRPDGNLSASTESQSFDALTRAALERKPADPLQKLPQDGPLQPTILPQAGLAAGTMAPAVDKNAAQPLNFQIDQRMTSPDWSKALGDHVMAMVNLKAEGAHIQISPPQLGPVEVTLKLDAQNNAQLTFAADSPATRAALENSLPKLHSMMAASGIQLGDAQVSSGQSQGQQQQSSRLHRFHGDGDAVEADEPDTLASIKAARGVLSIFA